MEGLNIITCHQNMMTIMIENRNIIEMPKFDENEYLMTVLVLEFAVFPAPNSVLWLQQHVIRTWLLASGSETSVTAQP